MFDKKELEKNKDFPLNFTTQKRKKSAEQNSISKQQKPSKN